MSKRAFDKTRAGLDSARSYLDGSTNNAAYRTYSGRSKRARTISSLHPGEILREEFLVPLGLSADALAKAMGVPRTRVERIAAETSGITADTALRLGKALGTSADLWLNLQRRYDLETAERAIGKDLAKIERLTRDAAE